MPRAHRTSKGREGTRGLPPSSINLRGRILVGACLGLAGFLATIQVADRQSDELEGVGQDDLVQLYSGYGAAAIRSRIEVAELEERLDSIRSATATESAQLREAQAEAASLSILSGEVAVQGPGIVLNLNALPDGAVGRDLVLALLNELRVASAEAMEINGVRIALSTVVDFHVDGIRLGAQNLSPPYVIKVIGSPVALVGSTNFPTGVVRQLTDLGYTVKVSQEEVVEITSLTTSE